MWLDDEPTVSPDGKRIAFRRDDRIWLMRVDGKGARPLTRSQHDEASPTWSPDGRRIAFARDFPDHEGYPIGELFVINADGTGVRRLTFSRDIDEGSPAWSPDGDTLVFEKARSATIGSKRLYLMNLRTGDMWRLTHSTDAIELNPDFSPHGKLIAYERDTSKGVSIRVIRSDGRARRSLPRPLNSNDMAPTWSPDGKHIAFVSEQTNQVGGTTGIYVMNANGTERTSVIDRPIFESSPDWGPTQK